MTVQGDAHWPEKPSADVEAFILETGVMLHELDDTSLHELTDSNVVSVTLLKPRMIDHLSSSAMRAEPSLFRAWDGSIVTCSMCAVWSISSTMMYPTGMSKRTHATQARASS